MIGEALWQRSIEQAEHVLGDCSRHWERMPSEKLAYQLGRKGLQTAGYVGWRVELDVEGEAEPLILVVDPQFPFSWPGVFTLNRDRFLSWPHVERDGRLCLIEHGGKHTSGLDAIPSILKDAANLILENRAGQLADDFATEFLSYWGQSADRKGREIHSLVRPAPPSRTVAMWMSPAHTVVAETDVELTAWLKNRFGIARPKIRNIPLVWLSNIPRPSEYPDTNGDVFRLVKDAFGEEYACRTWLATLADYSKTGIPVMLGVQTPDEPVFAGVWTRPVQTKDRVAILRGFRPNRSHKAADVIVRGLGPGLTCRRVQVARCDGAWMHARGGTSEQTALLSRSAIVLGCGSVGSAVATMLAQSGVGKIALVDPEILAYGNIARHALGAEAVGASKTDALEAQLGRRFPHLRVEAYPCSWERVHERHPGLLQSADVVVCLVGDILSEVALNYLARTVPSFPPVVFGWAENHAAAGHALVVAARGGCLECGLDHALSFTRHALEWPNGPTTLREPACGAFYQPYGALDMMPVNTLVTEAVLDVLYGHVERSEWRTWIGNLARIRAMGGEYATAFAAVHGEVGEGARVLRAPWDVHSECPRCR